ncbi:YiiX/YebB-like N1pC/P60 family cysteine hydrolase [Bacillus subtilis]|uniref:YiiX/YebB-like N1pC/P60 family cysteine hydrolase n=1 Tax=Bacillus subtilis TaxID=1423 RepID=UPI002DB7014C|nr:YiiX/YebB-like N1pC/P60 family cysteine hydrolase [Bacillus subtilis]MEC2198088.1 YiiX/YebB-like N1pC/P60 family cysteine hydrolase [Bacillus subtilis]MEC2331813.1 YiiX/YebB-like N1pC/P60 family cysteine hydrolase [Bacillus subtilis]
MSTDKFESIKIIKYRDLNNDLKNGDLLLCSGEYLVSKLIKQVSNSQFSHVGFIVKWKGLSLLIESVEDDGVRIVPLEHYLNNYENTNKGYNGKLYIARHKQLNNDNVEKQNKIIVKGLSLLNKNYDKSEIAQIVARIGLGLGKHKNNEEFICSEFVDVCFKEADICFSSDEKGFIFPEHIAADPNVIPIAQLE